MSVTDGITRIYGLADARYGEMLEFPGNTFGLALNLEQDSVGAVVLGEYKHLKEGDTVKTTGRILEVPVGPELLGRVVDALGAPIDGKGPVKAARTAPIERVAPGVIYRKSVSQPVQTGYKVVDLAFEHVGVFLAGMLDQLAELLETARVQLGDDGNDALVEQVPRRVEVLVVPGLDRLALAGAHDAAPGGRGRLDRKSTRLTPVT